jgi:predicted GIY-YIG superfamily endonuclease
MSNDIIYGLRLNKDKYYIGKTNRFPDRFEEYLNKNGANWTILHNINEIIFIVEKIEDSYEHDYTFLFMENMEKKM